jgi:hypothetical protein
LNIITDHNICHLVLLQFLGNDRKRSRDRDKAGHGSVAYPWKSLDEWLAAWNTLDFSSSPGKNPAQLATIG